MLHNVLTKDKGQFCHISNLGILVPFTRYSCRASTLWYMIKVRFAQALIHLTICQTDFRILSNLFIPARVSHDHRYRLNTLVMDL